MKHILENHDVFRAYAEIDYCYYMLEELQKELSTPKDAITIMVDRASGYGEARTKELKESSIELLKTIIKNKKIIEADYSNDEKTLEAIKQI